MTKYDILKQYFGYDSFRVGQEEIVDNILLGKDILAVMPTGAGKSLCFQVPSLLLNGVTLVISPLISLMKDQVGALIEAGVPAAYINSSLSMQEYYYVLDGIRSNAYKLVYIAPERLLTDAFLNLAVDMSIAMIVIDEAHCISQWGQDFRPSYLDIPEFVSRLKSRPIISAFTATATKTVRGDISNILKLNNPHSVITGFDRKNLYFAVMHPDNRNNEVIKLVREYTLANNRSGIVYCSTRKNVEAVCERLIDEGISATRYHAGLSDEERRANQDDFTYDRKRVMVATNAFGMGIDKSNVSYVIHYNMPKDVESYYQEAGRAGRDGSPADCILLYSGQDIITNRFLIEKSRDESELDDKTAEVVYKKDLERLKYMTFYCTTAECLREYILKYFGEKLTDGCDNCSFCCDSGEKKDITIESQKILSCIYRAKQKYGKSTIANVLKGSKNDKLLRQGLDKISTYAIMSDYNIKAITTMIDKLIYMGYIDVTEGDYPMLVLNQKANAVLMGKTKVLAYMPSFNKKEEKSKTEAYTKKSKAETSLSESDKELLSVLKKLRAKIANASSVPAYVVFNDATLHDMCKKKPTSKEAFKQVMGVGDTKLERYGDKFINEIKAYMKNTD